jgi:hypothetical protein
MAAAGFAQVGDPHVARAPRLSVLWVIALAGCAAPACSFALALGNDELAEPGLRAALTAWITLPFIFGGLVAWWRRPDSRFGPLMVAAGLTMFLSSLQWASGTVPYTIGLAFDLFPAALLLHVFLAFPSGRLQRRLERVTVVAGYGAAVGLQLVKMLLGGPRPGTSSRSSRRPVRRGRWRTFSSSR